MNSKEREALKLVLGVLRPPYCDAPLEDVIRAVEEALMSQSDGAQSEQDISKIGCVNHDCDKCKAQQEQEPVAWGNLANWCLDSDRVLITDKDEAAKYHRDVYDLTPLYTTPPQQSTIVRTAAVGEDTRRAWVNATTWRGLTDDERKNILIECSSTGDWAWELNAAQAIEAKLKEKNFSEEKNTK